MNPTLWITGIAGFTGRHLVTFLKGLTDKPRIVGLDLADRVPDDIDTYYKADLSQPEEVADIAQSDRPSWIIHLAGLMPPANEADMWQVNVGSTVSLLQGLASTGLRETRIVCIGSAAEYLPKSSDPLTESDLCGGSSLYGRIKWAQTLLAITLGSELGLPIMVVRPFNLIGPGLSTNLVAGWLCDQFARSEVEDIRIGNLESARDFIDIRDAVSAYWLVTQKGRPGEIYNVCSGTPATVKQLCDLLSEISGKSPRIMVDPKRIREADIPICYGDYTKIKQATGWQSHIQLRESLTAMLDFRQQSTDMR
ncbi:MAG: GDP-mannose 4,6-dehydratase [Planctomycetota bacterium]|nr:MAG: GDP-mannose 4,6-dehydratase [Planctomycetota bacterium]